MTIPRSNDVTSFTEHRRHLRDHLDQVRQTGRPLFVTTKGSTDAVVLSPEAYDDLAERAELAESLRAIDEGMEEMRSGGGMLLDDAFDEIASDLGLKLSR
ncbi:MAG: type II toxin-antitoxin system Phd/YefM family antitoxin [Acidobacteria bacterium]|nr:type II toxin-antitoxin system Phd/YefM family antitoxin [Acidobacteriota bacterium]